jgi:hypothetical protein
MYTIKQFEQDVERVKPRIFDTYILPGFLMAYAWKSKKMRLSARRALFIAGMYSGYRNYSQYKKAVQSLVAKIELPEIPEGANG